MSFVRYYDLLPRVSATWNDEPKVKLERLYLVSAQIHILHEVQVVNFLFGAEHDHVGHLITFQHFGWKAHFDFFVATVFGLLSPLGLVQEHFPGLRICNDRLVSIENLGMES